MIGFGRKQNFGWLPAVVLISGFGPVTWLLPSTVGYLLAGTAVLSLIAVGLFTGRIATLHIPIVITLAVYWLVILSHTVITRELMAGLYTLTFPVIVVGMIMVGSRLVLEDKRGFARTLVAFTVALALIGIGILIAHKTIGTPAYGLTGRDILAHTAYLRLSSVYANSNNFGFIMAIGVLTAIYLWYATTARHWFIAATFLFGCLVFSNSKASILMTIGIVTILSLYRHGRAVTVLLPLALVVIISAVTIGAAFFTEIVSSLLTRAGPWTEGINAILANPIIGVGFTSPLSIHNTYLTVFHNVGIVGGIAYLAIHISAFIYSLQNAIFGDLWDQYVFAVLVLIFGILTVETSTLGGLSTVSLILALFIGLSSHARQLRHGKLIQMINSKIDTIKSSRNRRTPGR